MYCCIISSKPSRFRFVETAGKAKIKIFSHSLKQSDVYDELFNEIYQIDSNVTTDYQEALLHNQICE